jgi:hypothetical protein
MPEIKFPVEVSGIDWDVDDPITDKSWQSQIHPVGSFVAVRSCKKEHGDKTYLGILIGWVPIYNEVTYDEETKRMTFHHKGDNPAIFVPDLKTVVLGCESWWGEIESEKHLREITNDDIQNIWYVKALKALAEKKEP